MNEVHDYRKDLQEVYELVEANATERKKKKDKRDKLIEKKMNQRIDQFVFKLQSHFEDCEENNLLNDKVKTMN